MKIIYENEEGPVEVYVPPEIFRDKVQMRLRQREIVMDVILTPTEARVLANELTQQANLTDGQPPSTSGEREAFDNWVYERVRLEEPYGFFDVWQARAALAPSLDLLSGPVLMVAAKAVENIGSVWEGFAMLDAKTCIKAAIDASKDMK